MKKISVLIASLGFISCAHDRSTIAHNFEDRQPAQQTTILNRDVCNDEEFRKQNTDPNGPTVWTLKEMVDKGELAKLDELFDHGIELNCLPVGYSAGTGAQVLGFAHNFELLGLDIPNKLEEGLELLTGKDWVGKIFLAQGPNDSNGLNRVRQNILNVSSEFIAQGHFETHLVRDEEKNAALKALVPTSKSNVVLLNYAHPVSNQATGKGTPVEEILKGVQVYDIMVPVKGKYGPVYVGKTWIGYYDGNAAFHPITKKLIARYFLDFNPGALKEQRANHWTSGSVEVPSPSDFSNATTQADLVNR